MEVGNIVLFEGQSYLIQDIYYGLNAVEDSGIELDVKKVSCRECGSNIERHGRQGNYKCVDKNCGTFVGIDELLGD